LRRFSELVARLMPFDLVIDETTAAGAPARVSKTSVCGSMGAIAGSLRFFADRFGVPRASIEGTRISFDLLRRYARREAATFDYNPRRTQTPLVLQRGLKYFGFELEHESEPIERFSGELAPPARRALSEALARSEARHIAVHHNRAAIEDVREMYRRSGAQTPRLGLAELTEWYEGQLNAQAIDSMAAFRSADLTLQASDFVSAARMAQLRALPAKVWVRDRDVEIDYDVEEPNNSEAATSVAFGVARLRLPEKLARTLTPAELPILDRSLRFIVVRGQRGALRADTLAALQQQLEGPWTPNEIAPDEAQSASQKRNPSRTAARGKARPKSAKFGRSGGPRRGGRR